MMNPFWVCCWFFIAGFEFGAIDHAFSRVVWWCLYFFTESLILAQDERWRRA